MNVIKKITIASLHIVMLIGCASENTLPPTPTETEKTTPTSIPTELFVAISTATAAPTPIEQLTPRTFTQESFSIILSDGWETADLDNTDFGTLIGQAGAQNDSTADLFSDEAVQTETASHIQFYAVNSAGGSLSAVAPITLNIIRQPLPIPLTLTEYAEINVAQLEQFFDLSSSIGRQNLRLGENEATRLSYSARLATLDGQRVAMENTQYLIVSDNTAYIITLAMPVEAAESYLELYREEIETFRLIESTTE